MRIFTAARSPISGYFVDGKFLGITNRQIPYLPQKCYTVRTSCVLYETVSAIVQNGKGYVGGDEHTVSAGMFSGGTGMHT